jgi:hypothetical protein
MASPGRSTNGSRGVHNLGHVLGAITHHNSIRLAEVGFLLMLIAGVWIVASEIPQLKFPRARIIVAGALLALAGALEIVAIHWGTFG